MSFISDAIIGLLKPMIKTVVKEKLKEALQKVNEKNSETYKTILVSVYPPIDVQLENLVKNTKTEIDDTVVLAMKEAFEESASENGVVLPNLDED